MISDELFQKYINDMSDVYEDIKDSVYTAVPRTVDAMDINEKLAKFRDIACMALRESHTTKNPQSN